MIILGPSDPRSECDRATVRFHGWMDDGFGGSVVGIRDLFFFLSLRR